MQQSGKHAGRGAGGEGNKAGPAGGGSKDAGAAEGGRPLSLSVLPVTALSCLAFGVRFWLGLARGVLGSPSHPPSGPLFVRLCSAFAFLLAPWKTLFVVFFFLGSAISCFVRPQILSPSVQSGEESSKFDPHTQADAIQM